MHTIKHYHVPTTAVVKHFHTCTLSLPLATLVLPCLFSASLLSLCLCLIGPRSTLDQHRRLISPPATRQHSPSLYATCRLLNTSTVDYLCTAVSFAAQWYAGWEHERDHRHCPPHYVTIFHTHSSSSRAAISSSTQTLTARINAHLSPVQKIPLRPIILQRHSSVTRRGILRASAPL